MENKITIKGAREHNLKNINLELPRNKMIVFTGLSGSGKSSLAFDTIFAEGQRRYVESLSAYARQFLGGMSKPDVDEIEGLSPAISIDQKAHSANPRSTVATITEIYDYLRVLYARIGNPHCPECGTKIEKMTTDEMYDQIVKGLALSFRPKRSGVEKSLKGSSKKDLSTVVRDGKTGELIILSPVVRGRKGEYYQMLYDLYKDGFLEVRVDGKIKSLKEQIILSKNKKHNIDVVVDKIPLSSRGLSADEVEKRSGVEACLSGRQGSLHSADAPVGMTLSKEEKERLSEAIETAVDLSNGLCTIIYPNKNEQVYSTEYSCPKDGFSFPEIEPRLFSFNSPYGYCDYCTGLGTKALFSEDVCPKCEGKRLNENALAVKINKKNIWEVTSLTISDAVDFILGLDDKLNDREKEIAGAALKEIQNRLSFMLDVGLHYLTLNRRAGTLSGGEAQRIRLASQVGQKLVGALYVLDEPTIGLHQRDNDRLVSTLRHLCDIGNTIITVEHDEDTIRSSDWVVDIGPGAGVNGGEIVYSGPTSVILNKCEGSLKNKKRDSSVPPASSADKQDDNYGCKTYGSADRSLTGKYLRGEENWRNKIMAPGYRLYNYRTIF